ncbi:hypothetical protein EJB05_42620, partial [Eragrostis curvula]
MAKESQRRRKNAKKRNRNQPTTTIDDLTDELLELIFLGLNSPACLIRAASSCKRWRYVIADADGGAAFLRRFRSLHEPPLIGHYGYPVDTYPPCSFGRNHCFPNEDPVFVPSSACTGRDLTLDFVPSTNVAMREVVDSRGSLLLLLNDKVVWLTRDDSWYYYDGDRMVPDLVICEPLTRRYKAITPVQDRVCIIGVFLLDGDDDDEAGSGAIGMDNFRVILVLYDPNYDQRDEYRSGSPYIYVTTCDSNGIRHVSICDTSMDAVSLPRPEEVHLAGRTGGRIYWCCKDEQVVVLDESTFKFSTMALPDRMKWNFHTEKTFRVLGGSDGGTLCIVRVTDDGDLEVYHQLHGRSTGDWVLEKSVWLAEASRGLPGRKDDYIARTPNIIRVQEGSVVLSPDKETWLFSVDIETMELTRENRRNQLAGPVYTLTYDGYDE